MHVWYAVLDFAHEREEHMAREGVHTHREREHLLDLFAQGRDLGLTQV